MGERALRRAREGHRAGKAAVPSLGLVLDLGYSPVSFCQHVQAQVDTESLQTQRLLDGGTTLVVESQYFTVIVTKVDQCVCF